MAKFCSKCGAPLREGAGFGPACGHKVSDPVPAPVSEPDNTAAPAPSPVPTEPVPQESGLVPRQEPAPAAGVKKTRYAIPAALIADLTGFVAASLTARYLLS